MIDKKEGPIFIHSMWRAGSTYIFNKFRTSKTNYFTLQESIHEIAIDSTRNKNILVNVKKLDPLLNHPNLNKAYFQELYDTFDYWNSNISKQLIYDQYFDKVGSVELKGYIQSIIAGAKGRPVFQECRTSGRIGALRSLFGGFHIFLLRNPHDQWWSILKDQYFTNALLMVANSKNSPNILNELLSSFGIQKVRSEHISQEFDYFNRYQLSDGQSYELFFTIWALAFLEAGKFCDFIIDMDKLNGGEGIVGETTKLLEELGNITNIDLSDFHIPRRDFSEDELSFFLPIELGVLDRIIAHNEDAEHASTLREAILSYQTVGQPNAEAYELRRLARHVMKMGATRMVRCRDELSGELDKLTAQLRSTSTQLEGAEIHASEATERSKALEKALSEADMQKASLAQELVATCTGLESARLQIRELETQAEAAERTKEDLLSRIQHAEKQEARMRTRLALIRALRRKDSAEAQERLAERESQIQALLSAARQGWEDAIHRIEKDHVDAVDLLKAQHRAELNRITEHTSRECARVREEAKAAIAHAAAVNKETLELKSHTILALEHEKAHLQHELDVNLSALNKIISSPAGRLARRLGIFPVVQLTTPHGDAIQKDEPEGSINADRAPETERFGN